MSRSAKRRSAGTTLADLLTLPELAGVRVVPADADLSVAVLAVAPYLAGDTGYGRGTVVFGPPTHSASPPKGCVAVIARTTSGDEPAVPLLVLPETAAGAQVMAAMVRALSDDASVSAAAARRALRDPLVAGAGYPAIVAVAAELLDGPVAVLDAYGDVVASAGLSEALARQIAASVEAARGEDPMNVIGPIAQGGVGDCLVVEVPGAAGSVGMLIVGPGDHDAGIVAETAEACAVEHVREEARLEAESRLRGELIEELVAGEVISRDSIVRRARLLGADLSNGAVGMIGTLKLQEGDGEVDERTGRRFLSHVRAVLDHEWPRALVDWSEGRMLALLPTPPDVGEGGPGVDERAHELARRLLGATRESVGGLAVTLALSRHTPDPERLGAALDEAELALSIGERLGRLGEVVTFEETGTYKLLFQIFADRPEELSAFYESTLAPLVAYDEQYQTALVGTLATYLELDGNLAATASTLYTHRHTVRYRLDRIAELAGLDVGKSDDREKLSLGLKAMRLLGRTVRSASEPRRTTRER